VLCDWNGLKGKSLTMAKDTIRAREALDRMCRDLGLDFGLYHGLVVITSAEVLWSTSRFGAPAADRQHRTPGDDKTLKLMRDKLTGVDFRGSYAEDAAIYMRELCGLPFELKVEGIKYATYFRASKKDCFSLLSAATQISGLDFWIDNGTVVVDTHDAVAKRLAGKK
jgi:hypothetical protein